MLGVDRFPQTGLTEVIEVPLSEYEQRVLNELEQQLASQDPALGAKMTSPPGPRRGRVAVGLAIGLVGLAALIIGMVIGQMWVSMLGFVLMFAGAYWALTRPKPMRAATSSPAAKPRGPRRPKLSERFEKRWEERGQG